MRLKTFGGFWIEGAPPPPALGPRRMALLAMVAAAGRRGVSRDRVLGILWPDSEEEQARHTLSQNLYSLKRDSGRDWIVAGSELRLDPGITSDVGELQEALAAGDAETAAALYTGAFLEGFYLPGAPEFERWVEEERSRLRGLITRAMELAAAEADRKGDHHASILCWTRLTELDPLSARYAAGRMRALVAADDRAGALVHARQHEALVRRELETDVEPAIQTLVRGLKEKRRVPASLPAPPLSAEPPEPTADLPRQAHEPARPLRRKLQPGPALLLAGALLLVLGVTLLRPSRPPAIPFLAVGAIRTPELGDTSSLGPVLRDMLATSLGGLHGLQVVANSRLVELTPPTLANERGATADAARRAGATEIIEGELASAGGGLVLTLRRVDLARGVVRKGYLVRAAERYALVDSAAAAVARDLGLASPSVGVREVRTGSTEAYVLYNEGLRAYFGFDGPGGLRLMQAALEQDSTFVMAAYYVWLISEWHGDGPTTARAFERVKRLAPHTIERERLLIQADVAVREAPLSVAAAIAETLTVRYPTDPDGHILLGRVRASQTDYSAAVAAFERAVTIDSSAGTTGPYCRMCLAMGNMIHAYQWWDSAGAAERVGRRIIAIRPEEQKHWNSLVEALLRQGRRAEALAALERSGLINLAFSHYTGVLHRDLLRWGRLEELDRKLRSDLLSPSLETREDARWLLLISLRDQGRLREGRALVRESRGPQSDHQGLGFRAELVLSSTLLQGMGRPDSAAKLLHADARRILQSPGPPVSVVRARNATWLLALASTAYFASGDTAAMRRLADSIEVIGKGSGSGRDTRLHHYLRGILLQRAGRHAEAVDQLRRAVSSLTDGYTVINLAMARSLLELGRLAEAIAVLRPAIHGGVDGSNTYTSRTDLHEAIAQAFALAGQRDSAVAHYRVVEQNWRRADPEFSERYQRAKAGAGM